MSFCDIYLYTYQCFLLRVWCTLYITYLLLISDFGTCQWCSSKSGHNDRTTRHRKSNGSSCFALHHRTVLRCDCWIRCTAGKLLLSWNYMFFYNSYFDFDFSFVLNRFSSQKIWGQRHHQQKRQFRKLLVWSSSLVSFWFWWYVVSAIQINHLLN